MPEDRIYTDHGLTGRNRDRPGLAQAMAAVRAGETLVVPQLDRLARSVPDARAIADELEKRGVSLALGKQVYDPNDPTNGQIGTTDNMSGKRISAERMERLLLDQFSPLLPGGGCPDHLFDIIANARFIYQKIQVALDASVLMEDGLCADVLLGRALHHVDPSAKIEGTGLLVSIDVRPLCRGRTVRPRADLLDACEQRKVLADLVRTAHRKLIELNASPLHPEGHANMKVAVNEWTRARMVIGFRAPDIQKAILQGTAPRGLDPDVLLARDFPFDWGEQRQLLGMSA